MKTWPGWRMRNASSSNAFGLIGDDLAVAQQAMAAEIGLDRPEIDDRRRPSTATAWSDRRKQRADPGGQLAQAERLGHVVVGAELEPDDLVELGVLGRQHDDRHAGLGPDDPADLDPRQLGEHQVEQDEVRALGPEPDQRLAAVGGGDDPESVGLERVDQRLAKGRLVVDDEDRSCHLPFRIAADVNGAFAEVRGPRPAARGDPARGSAAFAQPLGQLHVVLDELDASAVPVEAERAVVVVERPERAVRVRVAALADRATARSPSNAQTS